MDNIVALASAPGASGVAVIRVSGPNSLNIAKQITSLKTFKPRYAYFTKFFTDRLLDTGICLYLKAPNSFTGEDVIEFHTHGSTAIVNQIINFISSLPNARLAKAGEFTRRAFLNNKIDLTESEALNELIHADTELQRQQALFNMQGGLKKQCNDWKSKLLKQSAILESLLDFSDEELSHEIDWLENIRKNLQQVSHEIKEVLQRSQVSERLSNGFRVVLSGEPNVGKSSIINAFAEREVAIVTEIAGTTRDTLDVSLDIEGYPVILTDTAGLRNTSDTIEKIGINRAKQAIKNADVHIYVTDQNNINNSTYDILVFNKIDVSECSLSKCIAISAKTGKGLTSLKNAIVEKLKKLHIPSNTPLLHKKRQKVLLQETQDALQHAIDNSINNSVLEVVAEDLRLTLHKLGQLTGVVDVEEMLDALFGQFCIGK